MRSLAHVSRISLPPILNASFFFLASTLLASASIVSRNRKKYILTNSIYVNIKSRHFFPFRNRNIIFCHWFVWVLTLHVDIFTSSIHKFLIVSMNPFPRVPDHYSDTRKLCCISIQSYSNPRLGAAAISQSCTASIPLRQPRCKNSLLNLKSLKRSCIMHQITCQNKTIIIWDEAPKVTFSESAILVPCS